MHLRLLSQRGLLLLAYLLWLCLLLGGTSAQVRQEPAGACGPQCAVWLPFILQKTPPPPVTHIRWDRARAPAATSGGIVTNPFDVALSNVIVQIEWFVYNSPETVVQTTTATLTLPELLPGEASGFRSGISTYPRHPTEMAARARVLSWDTINPPRYEALTIVSAELEKSFPGSYDCPVVRGTLRNDHSLALRDVRLEVTGKVPGLSGSNRSPEWFDTLPGSLRQQDGGSTTTIGAGETLLYEAQNGCSPGWSPPEIELQVLARGVPVP